MVTTRSSARKQQLDGNGSLSTVPAEPSKPAAVAAATSKRGRKVKPKDSPVVKAEPFPEQAAGLNSNNNHGDVVSDHDDGEPPPHKRIKREEPSSDAGESSIVDIVQLKTEEDPHPPPPDPDTNVSVATTGSQHTPSNKGNVAAAVSQGHQAERNSDDTPIPYEHLTGKARKLARNKEKLRLRRIEERQLSPEEREERKLQRQRNNQLNSQQQQQRRLQQEQERNQRRREEQQQREEQEQEKRERRRRAAEQRREELGQQWPLGGTSVRPSNLSMNNIDYSSYRNLFSHHPHMSHVWSTLEQNAAARELDMIKQPPKLKMRLLPFQREGVWWMAQQESSMFHGGILADEMGMGKTLQTIALLLTNRGKPTLVVCPTVALMQWKAEIEMATDDLSVFVFYGNDRRQLENTDGSGVDMEELAKYDVILTTYAVMESGYRREHSGFRSKGVLYHEPSLLHSVGWFRLVLDEAHNIKDRSSNSARAAFALETQRVWALTGTPLHNRVGELFSLVRLTKADPFSNYFCHSCECSSLHWNVSPGGRYCNLCGHKSKWHFCYWNMHILKPIQLHSTGSRETSMAFRKLEALLDNLMLRRTKADCTRDLGLPPRIVVTRKDRFSPAEEELYVSLFQGYKGDFGRYSQNGTILNNYANVFELITRMRLAANHPDLLQLKVDTKSRIGSDATDTLVCAICNEEAEDPILSSCKHVFCRVDAQMYVTGAGNGMEDKMQCPMCFKLCSIDLEQPEMRMSVAMQKKRAGGSGTTFMETMMSTPDTTEYKRSIINRIDLKNWKSSTKIEALVEELSKHRRSNSNIKSIVFSQFVNFLDLIQWRLNRAGFSVCRLDGRMSPTQRDAVIRTFMTHPEYTVFLVSLKAGGVALNLTEASNVYLADVWWNPSVEVQAMDRIHRMGQYRPVKVTRMIVENSIESRIVSLQEKKQLLVNSTIGRDRKSFDQLSQQDMQFLFSS